jgi:putative membrane protein
LTTRHRPIGPVELDPAATRPPHEELLAGAARPAQAPLELPPDAALPEAQPPEPAPEPPPRRPLRRVLGTTLALGLGALLLWLLGAEVVDTLRQGLAAQSLGAVIYALLLLVVIASGTLVAGSEIWRWYRESRRLAEAEALAAEARAILAGSGKGRGPILAARIVAALEDRQGLGPAIDTFRRAASSAHSDRQVIALLADLVIRPLDAAAYAAVRKAVRDAAVLVAISPFGLLDAVLGLWRITRMVREIGAAYGFRPGLAGRWALLKRIFSTAATVGAADYVTNLVITEVGAGAAAMVTGRVGEGLVAGLRTARLGLLAMAVCRPLPFQDDDRASLKRLLLEAMQRPAG